MSSSKSLLQDSRRFTALSFSADADDNGIMSAIGIQFGTANDLRLGKYCMIGGFPSRIRVIQRSAPGKHGHAKLRVTGTGLFDQRKRETIFSAHDKVLLPSVETRTNVVCMCTFGGASWSLMKNGESEGLPSTFSLEEREELKDVKDGDLVVVTVVISCGHFHGTAARPMTPEEAASVKEEAGTAVKEEKAVLSKKEQRKQKKLLRKQAAVPAAC